MIYQTIPQDPSNPAFYIGSTTNFKKRIQSHQLACINPSDHAYDTPLYQYIRQYGGLENFTAQVLYYFDSDIQNPRQVEQQYIDYYRPSLNSRSALDSNDSRRTKSHNRAKEQQSMQCPCGGRYKQDQRKRHFDSKRHQAYQQILDNQPNSLDQQFQQISLNTQST